MRRPGNRRAAKVERVTPVVVALLAGIVLGPGLAPTIQGQDTGADWPQWRGPDRDGTVASFARPDVWPDRLTRAWQVEVGEGYATPVVIGSRVYSFTREGDDEVMRALDAGTGAAVWRTSYPAPFSFDPGAEPHGPGPKATPAFALGRLFTLGLGGVVTAFDADTGDVVWQVAAPPVGPLYGTSASPLVDEGKVIVHVGGHDDGALTAFDAATGEVRWAWPGDGPSYASPQVAEILGRRQIVTLSQDHVVGVDAETGELLWSRPFSTPYTQNIVDPVLVGDLVVVSGFQESTSAFRIVREGTAWTTEEVWENGDVSFYMTNGVLVEGRLLALSERNRGQYVLLDPITGETLWTSVGRRASNAAMLRAGETVFVLEDDGELVVGSVGAGELEEIRRYSVAESATWAQPAISGDRIFVKDATALTLWTLAP